MSDWFTATDPVTEGDLVAGGDPTWLPMIQDATGPRFPSNGALYRGSGWALPLGTFKIRTVDESKLNVPGCELCDANRDGDVSDRIGVSVRAVHAQIWVDTTTTSRSSTRPPMSPYKASGQIGHIGKDKATPRSMSRSRSSSTTGTNVSLTGPGHPYSDL